jgi:outer membrane protein
MTKSGYGTQNHLETRALLSNSLSKFQYPEIMLRSFITAVLFTAAAFAEVHTVTLQEAVNLALKQSPEVVLARLDEQRAREAVRVAKDPFTPKVYGGSGLAYTNGYPNSIEGSAPAIFEAKTQMALFNRPLSFQLAAARENARGASLDTQNKNEDVAYRTASLFLDAQQAARAATSLASEIESLQRVAESTRTRVAEGREIPLESKRAELNMARAHQRADDFAAAREYAEASLAIVLGFPAGDRVQATDDEINRASIPESQEATVAAALENSREIRRLESQLQVRMIDMRGYKAARLPVVDLVAQYSLLAKHNYQEFFNKFQRNNGQLGVAITIPLLVGSASKGYLGQAEVDIAKMRMQVNDTRNRISVDAAKSYNDVKRAENAREVARLDLDVIREQLTVLLAQLGEGRVPRSAVDEARLTEQEKWIAFYDAQNTVEKAKLNLLRQAGTILAALK